MNQERVLYPDKHVFIRGIIVSILVALICAAAYPAKHNFMILLCGIAFACAGIYFIYQYVFHVDNIYLKLTPKGLGSYASGVDYSINWDEMEHFKVTKITRGQYAVACTLTEPARKEFDMGFAAIRAFNVSKYNADLFFSGKAYSMSNQSLYELLEGWRQKYTN